MAKKMKYTIPSMDITLPDTYWIPSLISFDKVSKEFSFRLVGFKDQESRMESKNIIDSKGYSLQKAEAEQLISKITTSGRDVIGLIYDYVDTKKDVKRYVEGTYFSSPSSPSEPEDLVFHSPYVEPGIFETQPGIYFEEYTGRFFQYVSFFEGAEDI